MEAWEMSGYSIMIVDEDTAISERLHETFVLAGYSQVELCADPAHALDMFQKKKYHIVLADMTMPKIDGMEFLRRIREYDPLTQVIAMAAHSTLDRILTCLELGANGYLVKPFKSDEQVLEVVNDSVKKLERWREAIRETIAASRRDR
jgi:DNA-binding NtrC family response regulator